MTSTPRDAGCNRESPPPRGALVTGGGRGIGRGIVLALARRGWAVAINYRSDHDAARRTADEALQAGASQVELIPADVADLEAGRVLIEQTRERLPRFELFVSNAGVAPRVRRDVLEIEPDDWAYALQTNLRGPFFLAQAVARGMVADLQAGRISAPQIHFIGSVSAEMASVNRGEYCVAKAGLAMVARVLAVRLAAEGVTVYEIRPGLIATDMTAPVRAAYDAKIAAGLVPIPRWGEPGDVGHAVAELAAGALPYSTGAVIALDGGLALPRL